MDFFEAQEFAKSMYPGNKCTFQFDMDCMREMSFVLTEGQYHDTCHGTYNKVKVFVDGEFKHLIPIKNHRACFQADEMKTELNRLQMRPKELDAEVRA